MKRILYRIGMLAATALAFVACNKEVDTEEPQEVTHIATISIGKADATRTLVEEGTSSASYKWLADDDQYLHVYENGTEGKITDFVLSSDQTVATLTVSFTGTPTAPYSYTAKYAKTLSNSKNPLIQSEQHPAAASFDPAADVLFSKETEDVTSVSSRLTNFTFTMGRPVTVNKMILAGLEEGEIINSVEFTLDQDVWAYVSYDATNSKFKYTNGGKKLTMIYDAATSGVGVVSNDGTFPVYFISAPVEAASIVSVIVTTDQHLYTKSGYTEATDPFYNKSITFAVGTMKRFSMNMAGYGELIGDSVAYTLVEDEDAISDGAQYLIVNQDGTKAMGAYNSSKSYFEEVSVTAANKTITISSESVTIITLEAGTVSGQFYMKDLEGNYLYYTGTSNTISIGEKGSTNGYLWTVATDKITNVGTDTRYLQYNATNTRFACYQKSSNQKDVVLYVNEATLVPVPKIVLTPTVLSVGYQGVSAADDLTYELKNLEGTPVVTCDGTVVTEAIGDEGTILYTVSANDGNARVGWIKVSVGEVIAEVTVNQEAAPTIDFTTVAGLNALVTSTTEQTYSGRLTDAVVSFVPNTGNAIIKDDTGSILVYKSGHGLLQGQTFSGELTVKAKLFNTTIEITDIDAEFTGPETVVEPETMTLSTLVGHFATYQNAYVKVNDLTVTAISGKNISVSNGDYEYIVYDNAGESSVAVDDIISVTGTVGDFKGTNQVKAWTSNAIVITQQHQVASHAITFTQPDEGGTFTVTVDGDEIESGDEFEEGTEVTLTATAAEGYKFDGWIVSGATVSGNSTTTTFSVGTSNVTISASFSLLTAEQVLIIDGSKLTSTATTSASTIAYDDVDIVFSSGAKQQSSSGDNKFTDKAILIGKSGAYIYNSEAIPGTITKFEIYANKGASAKVSVGVYFSDSEISEYNATSSNTYTATLSTLDSVYDCSGKLPENAKYFWYQVTNANNSQVEFRITYIPNAE